MKKFAGGLGIFTMLLILTGCPLMKDFPIDSPSVKVNAAWYGSYIDEGGKTNWSAASSTITIAPSTEYEYKINELYFTTDTLGETVTNENSYRAHVSKIKGVTFLNVTKSDEAKYNFYKIETSGKDLKVTEVAGSCGMGHWSDNIYSSSDLKKAFEKYAKNPLFYGTTFDLKRN